MLSIKKTPQTRRGDDGNCFEACIATLTGADLDSVPSYRGGPRDFNAYLAELDSWLQQTYAVHVVALVRTTCPEDDRVPDYVGSTTYWIASLRTSDGPYRHAVVMCGGELFWDPEGAEDLAGWPDLLHRIDSVALLVPSTSENACR